MRSGCIQLILHAQVMGARHVLHSSGMPGQKHESPLGSQRFGLSAEELGAPFSNPRFAWQELPLSHWECWIPCTQGIVGFVSDKVSYPRPEGTLLNENVFRSVPEESFSLDESAFSHNKILLKHTWPSLLAGIQISILDSEISLVLLLSRPSLTAHGCGTRFMLFYITIWCNINGFECNILFNVRHSLLFIAKYIITTILNEFVRRQQMKDISSFIVIHSYNFAVLFVNQEIFETSSSKKTPKKPRFSCFLIDIIYLEWKRKVKSACSHIKKLWNRCIFSIYKYITCF